MSKWRSEVEVKVGGEVASGYVLELLKRSELGDGRTWRRHDCRSDGLFMKSYEVSVEL